MTWPASQEINEAIQTPSLALSDPDLRSGRVAVGAHGLPLPRSGNFADVYQLFTTDGRSWAVKCFTRPVIGLDLRYQRISEFLAPLKLPFIVPFAYQPLGIRVRGATYPLVKMEWVEGLLLHQFVRDHTNKASVLANLFLIWARLAGRLRESGIAHADLQHGNVLLVPASRAGAMTLKLIDYDGMYVPPLANHPSGELGHAHYQHPERAARNLYSPDVDRFPLLLVGTVLKALQTLGRPLWERYDNGENLLFTEADLLDPASSRLMHELWNSGDLPTQALLCRLLIALRRPIPQTPWLDHLLTPDGEVIPPPPEEIHQALAILTQSASPPGYFPSQPPTPAGPVPTGTRYVPGGWAAQPLAPISPSLHLPTEETESRSANWSPSGSEPMSLPALEGLSNSPVVKASPPFTGTRLSPARHEHRSDAQGRLIIAITLLSGLLVTILTIIAYRLHAHSSAISVEVATNPPASAGLPEASDPRTGYADGADDNPVDSSPSPTGSDPSQNSNQTPPVKPPESVRPKAPSPREVDASETGKAIAPSPRLVDGVGEAPVMPRPMPPAELSRRPIPTDAEVSKVQTTLRELYRSDYQKRSLADRKALAAKLLGLAESTTDDWAGRYAALIEALDLAVEAQDVALVMQIVDSQIRVYDLDPNRYRLQVLEKLASQLWPAETRVAVAVQALKRADERLANAAYEYAEKFADVAYRCGIAANSKLTAEDALVRKRFIKRMIDLSIEAEAALSRLATMPEDASAHWTVGRFRCFIQGDWEGGLKHLAQAADAGVKAAALAELEPPGETPNTLRRAELWWTAAQSLSDPDRLYAEARARYWYRLALPGLEGLPRAVAEHRLGFSRGAIDYAPGLAAQFTELPRSYKTRGRVDPTIDFVGSEFAEGKIKGKTSPSPVGVTWQGVFLPNKPGVYVLELRSRSMVRLSVDNRVLIDSFNAKPERKSALVAYLDKPLTLRVDFRGTNSNGQSVQLVWRQLGTSLVETIPAEVLFHDRKLSLAFDK